MNKNKNIALIGCGYWGTILANNLLSFGFNNLYIYDFNKKNSEALKKKFKKVIVKNSYENLLKDKSVDIFFFATPPSKNFSLIKKAIINNKNIFLEKPGFKKINDFYKIKKIKMNNNILMFGYVYCYNDYIQYIKNIINKKVLGKILHINFQRQNLGPIRNDVQVAEDLSSHDLSIILDIFKKLTKVIYHNKYSILKKKISDISNLHMKLNEAFIDINNTWLSPTKIRRITIIGSKKMLLFDEMDLLNPIKIYNKYAVYPKIEDFKKSFFQKKALIYEGKVYLPKIKCISPLKKEMKHFFDSINKKQKLKTDFDFAFKISNFLSKI